jgi:hypothetical protein
MVDQKAGHFIFSFGVGLNRETAFFYCRSASLDEAMFFFMECAENFCEALTIGGVIRV